MQQQPPYSPLRIVVLISGGGTTLRNLLEKIESGQLDAEVGLVISSNATARGLAIAREAGVAAATLDARLFKGPHAYGEAIFGLCRAAEPHLVVMGGFLKLITVPPDYNGRVVNIHPALIPAFCGHGFYGHKVHEAVLKEGAK